MNKDKKVFNFDHANIYVEENTIENVTNSEKDEKNIQCKDNEVSKTFVVQGKHDRSRLGE